MLARAPLRRFSTSVAIRRDKSGASWTTQWRAKMKFNPTELDTSAAERHVAFLAMDTDFNKGGRCFQDETRRRSA
jgi:hypothetical protein